MKKIEKIILSRTFPELFMCVSAISVLCCLLLCLSLTNFYTFSGDYSAFLAARELLFSAVGSASVSSAASYCFCRQRDAIR